MDPVTEVFFSLNAWVSSNLSIVFWENGEIENFFDYLPSLSMLESRAALTLGPLLILKKGGPQYGIQDTVDK